jgi:hypothetical protein
VQACLQVDEKMALRNEDREWVQNEIALAIASLRPHGWRKAGNLLRELGPIAASIGVVVALLGITLGALYQSWGHVKEETEFRTHTNDTLKEIQDGIKEIRASIAGAKVKQVGSNPTNPENIAEAKNILKVAASNNTKIDPGIVKDVGTQFVEAAQKDPAAWGAALAFLNYRTFINTRPSLPGTPFLVTPEELRSYDIPDNILNHEEAQVSHAGVAPQPNAAQLHALNAPDLNAKFQLGNAFLIIGTARLLLDNIYMKNIIVENSHVIYRGGPFVLENVTFVNCTFEVVQRPSGVEFAEKLLVSPSGTSFRAS